MKKIIAFLTVVALTASCFASTITISATTSGSADTVVISYTASAVLVGASLKLSLVSGVATIAAVGDVNNGITPPLQAYVDWAYTNGTAGMDQYGRKAGAHPIANVNGPGAKAFPVAFPMALSMANLGPNPAPLTGTLAKIKLSVTSSICLQISADTAGRGGFIDQNGQPMTANLPMTVCFGGCAGCCTTCKGDLNGDGRVRTTDLGLMISCLNNMIPEFPCTNPCADMNGDGRIRITDLGLLISAMNTYGTNIACPIPGY